MDLLVPWFAFPVVLLALSAGWGYAVGWVSGVRLPGPLVLPAGFAAVVVVSGIVTALPVIAWLATPVVVGGAAAGLAGTWPWRRPTRLTAWPAASAALVFCAYAAPIVLSGDATFAGFLTLDDTATLWAMTDRMLDEGRTVDGLAPSTYEATLATSLTVGYPMGSLLPLGVGARLVGEDVAWVFQPYLAVIAALLALVLWQVLSAVAKRWWRLVAVVVAAQPAILYGYGLWTGVKELTSALLVALAASLAFERRGDVSARGWIPLAMAAAAILGVLSVGGVVWLLPLGVWIMVDARSALRPRSVAVAGVALVVLALPAVAEAASWFRRSNVTSLRDDDRLANLIQPLNPLQSFGIWPAGDFRLRPEVFWPTIVLVLLVVGLASVGLVRSLHRRDALVPYAACALFGALAYWAAASPWIEGKAFAIASPAALALAGSGCAWFTGSGRRVAAGVAAALVAGGVLWSNVYAYGNVNLAPRDQLVELERIGDDFAGQGPALMTEYQPYGVRHFIRRLDPEGASELRRRIVRKVDGSLPQKGETPDLDELALPGVLVYRTIVMRRSPVASRPPAPYELLWRGRWYEVWQRPAAATSVVAHLPLGDAGNAGATPSCADVLGTARKAKTIATAVREPPVAVLPARASGVEEAFVVPQTGRYSLWLAGSRRSGTDVFMDGQRIASVPAHLDRSSQYTDLGSTVLARGLHTVRVQFERGRLEPGTGGPEYGLGPLVVTLADQQRNVTTAAPGEAAQLCGRTLDWVEALG